MRLHAPASVRSRPIRSGGKVSSSETLQLIGSIAANIAGLA
jgi:hypothetical protein